MPKMNRKYKDTIFCDLFYQDKYAKQNNLDLYNALYNENLTDPDEITLMRLENTLFMDFYNDTAFSVGNRRIILSEHQSTINYNSPLRDLLYISGEYEQYFPTKVRYKKKAVRIPTPEFITFYNGIEDFPKEAVMRLSDSFAENESDPMLELTVRVININPGKNHEILQKCRVLREYSMLVEKTRKYGKDKESLEKAVRYCIEKGILTEYLSRKGKAALNMLYAEYNYEDDIAVQREEAAEEAWNTARKEISAAKKETAAAKEETAAAKEETAAVKEEAAKERNARLNTVKKMYQKGMSMEEISDMCGYSMDEVQHILCDL